MSLVYPHAENVVTVGLRDALRIDNALTDALTEACDRPETHPARVLERLSAYRTVRAAMDMEPFGPLVERAEAALARSEQVKP
jgi:hypothetical protein